MMSDFRGDGGGGVKMTPKFGHMEVPGSSMRFLEFPGIFFDGFFYIYSGYTFDHITIASFRIGVPTILLYLEA